MIKEKMDLDIQVARLRTLKAAYNSQHYRLEDAVTGIFLREIRGTECRIQAFEKDMQTAKDSQSYDKDGKLVSTKTDYDPAVSDDGAGNTNTAQDAADGSVSASN